MLLLRRHRYTGTVSYYLCWSPRPVPLTTLIAVAVTRWKIEEDHQLTKQATALDCGLDARRGRPTVGFVLVLAVPLDRSESPRLYPSPNRK